MVLPRIYRTTGEGVIASYDFNDIISGVAYEVFYLGNTKEDTTISYVLSPNSFYSNDVEIEENIAPNTASFTLVKDIDFDVVLGIPRIIEGVAILSIPMKFYISGGAGHVTGYYIAKLRSYDGSSETEIASAQSESNNSTDGTNIKIHTVHMVVPKTSLKVGDTLRLTLELYLKNAHGSNQGTLYVGCDPKNREGDNFGAGEVTEAVLHLPFKPDL